MAAGARGAGQTATQTPAINFWRDTGKQLLFAPNSRVSITLDRGMVYRELYLRLTGNITMPSAASNVAANMFPGDEWALIQDIVIRLNGNDILKRVSGAALRWLNYQLYGTFPMKAGGQLGNGTSATAAIDSTLIIPFWMPRSARPMDFALDTRNLARVDLEVQFGNFTNINSTATAFGTAPVVQVFLHQVTNVTGQFSRWNVLPISVTVPAVQNRFQIPIPVGYLYRAFMINDPGFIIKNLYIESGPSQWVNLAQDVLTTAIAQTRRGNDVSGALTNNTQWLVGATGDNINNWIYFDHCSDGFNAESIDTFGMSEFYLYVDTQTGTYPASLTVYPFQLVVPRG